VWDIIAVDATWHTIKNNNTGKCLDVPGGSTGDVQLWQYTCNGTDAQKFTVPSGTFSFGEVRNKASNKCVDVQYSAVGNGTVIWQYTCNGTRAQKWTPDNHNVEKKLYTDRWYQFYEDSYNYTTWMTLLLDRNVGSYGGTWNSPITNAVGAWNNPSLSTNTVYLSEVQPSVLNDVRVYVVQSPSNDLGFAHFFDENGAQCGAGDCGTGQSRPNTWWYVYVYLNNRTHTGSYGTSVQRQATAAHELGHSIVLDHDGTYDDACPSPGLRQTVMDNGFAHDCNEGGINVPKPWDSCGINHAYYDPTWSFQGC
jgi:hypothetical protein